jgi:hypothetical protein
VSAKASSNRSVAFHLHESRYWRLERAAEPEERWDPIRGRGYGRELVLELLFSSFSEKDCPCM